MIENMPRKKKETKGELVPVTITEIDKIFGKTRQEERVAMAEEIGAAKLSGKKTTEIALKYSTSTAVVHNLYKKFLEMNKVSWLSQRGATVSEINMRYQKKMQDAEANYRKCEGFGPDGQAGMALWTKIMCDIMKNYVEFLKSIGYIDQATALREDNSIKKEDKEPINLIVTEYKQYLITKMGENNEKKA